ncbi:unnamed protein product [marine sediment metagenome]|uniref:Uncharacterized protein n=2 Tax=marine sediment metagenome TaxID=412755 RepID=X1UBY6_9ZZZZ
MFFLLDRDFSFFPGKQLLFKDQLKRQLSGVADWGWGLFCFVVEQQRRGSGATDFEKIKTNDARRAELVSSALALL